MNRHNNNLVTLSHEALKLVIAPDLGGSVMHLTYKELPILRPTPAQASHAVESAAFPLFPYSNRIGHGRMRWMGQTYKLPSRFDAGPHALHGVAWMRAWVVTAQTPRSVSLSYEHSANADWPFDFMATQHFEVVENQMKLTLTLQNTGQNVQPAGLGWHPFFVRRTDGSLKFTSKNQWLADAEVLPTHSIPCAGVDAPVASLALDHCFDGWTGIAQLQDAQMSVQMRSDCSHMVIYTPSHADFYCVEPVSHLNNAIQQADPTAAGLVALSAGQSLTRQVELTIEVF